MIYSIIIWLLFTNSNVVKKQKYNCNIFDDTVDEINYNLSIKLT